MTAPPKSLAEAVERLRARNEQLRAHLEGDGSAVDRVANAPETTLEDATERARKHWDKLEGRRSSIPPQAKVSP
jgi:predicted amidohydrolase YtcJ